MPEALARFLAGLPNEEAELIWVWLDGNPGACEQMIEAISENHPSLAAANENPPGKLDCSICDRDL